MKRLSNSDMTPDQQACVYMLAEWRGGLHHLPKVYECGRGVCINIYDDLATHDFNRLTMLVLLAHKHGVRIEVSSSGPRMVRVIAHKRKHGDRAEMKFYEWHPTLEDLKAQIDKMLAPF